MEKTMLDFLNEVSKEKGFESWYMVYHIKSYDDCNLIPQEAGVRFAAQQVVSFNSIK